MTRDVFKYFKHVRSLQEDKGAEKAAELGYQHQARGVYIDPKTQKRYKNVGDKLEPIVVEPTAEKGGGQQKPDTKSLGQFKKDATSNTTRHQQHCHKFLMELVTMSLLLLRQKNLLVVEM